MTVLPNLEDLSMGDFEVVKRSDKDVLVQGLIVVRTYRINAVLDYLIYIENSKIGISVRQIYP